MGVDLTLMPLTARGPGIWIAHDLIEVERRRELWPTIENLPQHKVQYPLACFVARDPKSGECCYGYRHDDPYGDPLRFTTAGDLVTLKEHPSVLSHWRNRAVWAYLGAMPPDSPIILYWH